jgi:hypothetical protein
MMNVDHGNTNHLAERQCQARGDIMN